MNATSPKPITLPRVIGHRGAARHAPENTLAGLAAARRLGVDWVEFDVMLSADGHPLLMHDDSLRRTTGLDRVLCDTPLAEVERLDAGGWFGPGFAGERVPTLRATFAALARLGLGANIEIKPAPGQAAATAEATVEAVRRAWPAALPTPLISSFDVTALETVRRRAPELPLGYLVEELPADWQATAERLNCVSIHPWHEPLTEAQTRRVKAAGYLLAVYTVNDGARARTLLDWGVDSLITDDPPALGL